MIRRGGAALALGLTMALVAGACGGSSSSGGNGGTAGPDTQPPSDGCELPTTTATDPATEPIVITVWEPYQGRMQTALDRVVARYNASQRQVKVVLDSAGTGPAEQARFDAAVATPTPTSSLPTIVVLGGEHTQAVADSKVIVPASTCGKSAEEDPTSPLPSVRAAYTVNKKHWAGATTLDTPMLYINRAHFTRAGLDPEQPPRTLKELAEVATKLKQAGVSAKPLALPMSPLLVENWLTGAGANVVDHDNGRTALASASEFDNPRTLELYQWLHDAQAGGLVDAVPAASPQASLADLVTQTSSMAIAPASSIGVVDAFVEGRGDSAALGLTPGTTLPSSSATDLDVAPLPGLDAPGRGQVEGDAWYVTTASTPDQRAAAWAFLGFLGDVTSQVRLNLEASIPPSNTKAVDDPALQAVWGKTRQGHWLDTAYTQVTNFDSQAPGPLIGPSTPVEAAIAASFGAILGGTVTPAEAIATADKAIDEAVKAYAQDHPAS